MKRIVLCADDFGQAPSISHGICQLIQSGRLSATSCLVNSSYWPLHAKWLDPFKSYIDVGLHFNLTQGKALSSKFVDTYGEDLWPLSQLIKQSLLKRLNQAALEAECIAQIDQFAQIMGFLPRFIDGHQHVHQLPIVRHALLKVYEDKLRKHKAHVRLVNTKIKPLDLFQNTKKIVIYMLGTKAFKRSLDQQQIPYNSSFAGIYNFSSTNEYRKKFKQFLAEISHQGLIMCHPALVSTRDPDPYDKDEIMKARQAEYQYLAGNDFLTDCHTHGVSLGRLENI